jgi:hypothetical protein
MRVHSGTGAMKDPATTARKAKFGNILVFNALKHEKIDATLLLPVPYEILDPSFSIGSYIASPDFKESTIKH